MKARSALLRVTAGIGALVGYGCLIAFLYLVSVQIYHWFRDGEWTHFGMSEGIVHGLTRCCSQHLDSGTLGGFVHWLNAPAAWLGLHEVFEVMPASLALFLASIAGNCLFVYSRDRLALANQIDPGSLGMAE